MKRILTEPLLHFFLIGAVFFALNIEKFAGNAYRDASRTIVVNEQNLVQFLRYRSPDPDRAAAAALLSAMSRTESENLIRSYVEEEALFREAQSLNLMDNDEAIRQRLIQQTKYLIENTSVDVGEADIEALRGYFEENR